MSSSRWLEKFGRIIWNIKFLHNPGWTPNKGHVQLNRDNITITGQRDPITGLYYINLPQPPPFAPPALHPFDCSAYEMKTKAELVQYLHQCAFSPVVHTWTKAIDARYFATWPGLTSKTVRKRLPRFLATAKGHLKQDQKRYVQPNLQLYHPLLSSQASISPQANPTKFLSRQ